MMINITNKRIFDVGHFSLSLAPSHPPTQSVKGTFPPLLCRMNSIDPFSISQIIFSRAAFSSSVAKSVKSCCRRRRSAVLGGLPREQLFWSRFFSVWLSLHQKFRHFSPAILTGRGFPTANRSDLTADLACTRSFHLVFPLRFQLLIDRWEFIWVVQDKPSKYYVRRPLDLVAGIWFSFSRPLTLVKST